jgi:hypothetical protein
LPVAGCAQVADLGQFENFTEDDASADAMDGTTGPDVARAEAAADHRVDDGAVDAADAVAEVGVGDDGPADVVSEQPVSDGGLDDGSDSGDGEAGPACVSACSTYGATATACTMGACTPTCASYFGDCNASSMPNPDDGCETYLDSLMSCTPSCSTPGVACGPTQVCNAGICGDAHGLVAWSVPLTANGQIQRYADRPLSPWSLTGAEMIVRMYAPGATGGDVAVYETDQTSQNGPGQVVSLSVLATGWTDIVLPPATSAMTFDPTMVKQVTFEIQANGNGPWANPTVVYVDSVRASNVAIDDTFDSDIGTMVTSTLLTVPGSNMSWVPAVPAPDGGDAGNVGDGGDSGNGAGDAGDAGSDGGGDASDVSIHDAGDAG